MEILLLLQPHDSYILPYGIMYISSALKRAGFHVHTQNLQYINCDIETYLMKVIDEKNIGCIGLGGFSWECSSMRRLFSLAKEIKPDIITIAGGGIITAEPEVAMTALNCDFGVIGEGEETICELCDVLQDPEIMPLNEVSGIIYWKNGKLITTDRRKSPNLDNLPFPDREGFAYSVFLEEHSYFGIFASRSCPHQCTFCFHAEPYRKRSLDSIFNELDDALSQYRLTRIHLYDELFSAEKDWFLDFCSRIAKYHIAFDVYMRVNDVDEAVVMTLKKAGCISIGLGLESYHTDILRSMKKKITPRQIDYALGVIRKCGIGFLGNFILGDTNDTRETVQESLNYRVEHPEYNINIYMVRTLPGSEIYREACARGVVGDRVKFLMDDCPLINVSRLDEESWRAMSDLTYEESLCADRYATDYRLDVITTLWDTSAIYTMICPRCGEATSFVVSLYYQVKKAQCKKCLAYYTLDPFRFVQMRSEGFMPDRQSPTVIWGAGEIALKLLRRYSVLSQDNFRLIDSNKDLHGMKLHGKEIFDISEAQNVSKCLITAIKSKRQVVKAISRSFSSINEIFVPIIERNQDRYFLKLEPLTRAQIDYYSS